MKTNVEGQSDVESLIDTRVHLKREWMKKRGEKREEAKNKSIFSEKLKKWVNNPSRTIIFPTNPIADFDCANPPLMIFFLSHLPYLVSIFPYWPRIGGQRQLVSAYDLDTNSFPLSPPFHW